MTQPTLDEAIKARDEAIQRVEDHAHQEWLEVAYAIVCGLATVREEFSTDDVWGQLSHYDDVRTHEPRAMGAVMKRAVANGVIKPEGYTQSTRKACHARPVRTYRSTRRAA